MKEWRNIPGTELIWHGEWADPEIIYKGKSVNYWSVEDALELSYRERKPHYLAEYLYNLCTVCNIFYQTNHISGLEDKVNKNDWLYVLTISNNLIKEMLYLLGIEVPTIM